MHGGHPFYKRRRKQSNRLEATPLRACMEATRFTKEGQPLQTQRRPQPQGTRLLLLPKTTLSSSIMCLQSSSGCLALASAPPVGSSSAPWRSLLPSVLVTQTAAVGGRLPLALLGGGKPTPRLALNVRQRFESSSLLIRFPSL